MNFRCKGLNKFFRAKWFLSYVLKNGIFVIIYRGKEFRFGVFLVNGKVILR